MWGWDPQERLAAETREAPSSGTHGPLHKRERRPHPPRRPSSCLNPGPLPSLGPRRPPPPASTWGPVGFSRGQRCGADTLFSAGDGCVFYQLVKFPRTACAPKDVQRTTELEDAWVLGGQLGSRPGRVTLTRSSTRPPGIWSRHRGDSFLLPQGWRMRGPPGRRSHSPGSPPSPRPLGSRGGLRWRGPSCCPFVLSCKYSD